MFARIDWLAIFPGSGVSVDDLGSPYALPGPISCWSQSLVLVWSGVSAIGVFTAMGCRKTTLETL